MIKFSILMANYNGDKYIETAIQSVLYQTFRDWELIIIDDYSNDNSIDIINKYITDKRIKLVKNSENLGYGRSLNIGVQYINSNFFGTLDSDDILTEDAIEIMYQSHMENLDCSMIYSQFNYYDNDMNFLKSGYCAAIPENKTNLEMNTVSHFRTHKLNYFLLTSGYHRELKSSLDKDIIFKMEEVGKLKFINKVLYLYRKHKDGISQKKGNKSLINGAIAKQEAIERREQKDARI